MRVVVLALVVALALLQVTAAQTAPPVTAAKPLAQGTTCPDGTACSQGTKCSDGSWCIATTNTVLDPSSFVKPVVLSAADSPRVTESLQALSAVLSKEPESAQGDAVEEFERKEKERQAENAAGGGLNLPCAAEGCTAGAAGNGDKEIAEGLDGKGKGAKAAGAKGVQNEIQALERLIQHAMKISKAIPAKVKRLEELKKTEEAVDAKNARQQAEKTLAQHRRLISQLAEHLTSLNKRVAELQAEKTKLEESDNRLQGELNAAGSSLPSNKAGASASGSASSGSASSGSASLASGSK